MILTSVIQGIRRTLPAAIFGACYITLFAFVLLS
jgi:hypothetical protein